MVNDPLHDLLDTHAGRVDLQRIRRRYQRRGFALPITRISLRDLCTKTPKISIKTLLYQLLITALGAGFGTGREEHLGRRVGKITVPISRPSATSPGKRRNPC